MAVAVDVGIVYIVNRKGGKRNTKQLFFELKGNTRKVALVNEQGNKQVDSLE